jgi:hypothetical protein
MAKQRADASCNPDDRTPEVPMSQLSLSIDGELAKLVLHNPPQNRLTQALFAALGGTIAEIGRSLC